MPPDDTARTHTHRGYGVLKQGGALVGAKLKEHMHKQHRLGNAKMNTGYYSY